MTVEFVGDVMIIILKILIDLTCGILFSWGGYNFLAARRYIMPSVLAVGCCIVLHSLWGLLVTPVMGTLCLGYFSGHNWGRALWLFLQAVIIGIGLTISGHLAWTVFIPYIITVGILGGIYKNWQQTVGDIYAGIFLGSIIFFVR